MYQCPCFSYLAEAESVGDGCGCVRLGMLRVRLKTSSSALDPDSFEDRGPEPLVEVATAQDGVMHAWDATTCNSSSGGACVEACRVFIQNQTWNKFLNPGPMGPSSVSSSGTACFNRSTTLGARRAKSCKQNLL